MPDPRPRAPPPTRRTTRRRRSARARAGAAAPRECFPAGLRDSIRSRRRARARCHLRWEFTTIPAYLCEVQGDRVYPYLLDPKLTTQVWGGHELVQIYGKKGDPNARLGESWECWDA